MSLFVELLQVSLGSRDKLSRVPTVWEWNQLLEEAENQAIVGVLLCGLEKLPAEQLPPVPMKLQWIGETQMIEHKNRIMTTACGEVVKQLENDGFQCCVLKGQANHRYYNEKMRLRRSSGDIDIWVIPDSGEWLAVSDPVKTTLEYIENNHELTGLCWLHCNFNHSKDVPVEVHFRPSFMNNPCKNSRFVRYFADIDNCVTRESVDGVELPVMKVEEDVVYQMNHIYRHLIDEGIGLRQIVDYFFLLRKYSGERFLYESGNKTKRLFSNDTMKVVTKLGMKRFAGALMYVMREMCGMPKVELLCEPNNKDGKFLLSEILTAGNFGQSDPRMSEIKSSNVFTRQICQAWRRFKRNIRFLTSYPGEVIWEPVARINHFVWKHLKLWNY